MKQRFIVISTDGYEIDTEQFTTYDKAYDYMSYKYHKLKPKLHLEEYEQLSYLGDYKALLYCNGLNVYCWSICRVVV